MQPATLRRHAAQMIPVRTLPAGVSKMTNMTSSIPTSSFHKRRDSGNLVISVVCQFNILNPDNNDQVLKSRDPTQINTINTSKDMKSYHDDVNATKNNHSNDNIDEIHETTDFLYRLGLPCKEVLVESQNKCLERRCSLTIGYNERKERHKEDDECDNELISLRKREGDIYGRIATYLKFKCTKEWTEAHRRTMGGHVRAFTVFGLVLMMLSTSFAAPNHRFTRSTTNEKTARRYLETFGYLSKDQPQVGNLLHGDAALFFEDDYRIAIKTLQKFGGIPVTGEIDEATEELMKKRRCGRPDVEPEPPGRRRRKRFLMQGEKWKHTNLTWSLSSSQRPSQLDPHGTRAVLARALDVWAQASRLTFTELSSDDADIVVSFAKRNHGDAYPFDGRGSILAHAFFPGSGRGGDAHFDDDELWLLHPNNDEEEGTSLFAVAVHEFGHSLGLSHSSVKGALMYPWYQGIQPNFVLPEDDKNGIQQMYGQKDTNRRTWGKIPHYGTPPTTTTTTTTTTSTTTRRPHRYPTYDYNPDNRPRLPEHPGRRPSHPGSYPDHPGRRPEQRPPFKYPSYYPVRPNDYPDRRQYNTTEDNPRRNHHHHHHPRPTETTTHPTTSRPRYPNTRPEYPTRPDYPNTRPEYPNTKKPYTNYPRPTDRQDYPKPEVPKKKPHHAAPDTCDTTYDAVALIRNELFIFKNRYHWRIGANGRYKEYPIEISNMWPGLPRNLTHVDAVYERPDKKIAFFVGKELYLFDSQYLVSNYPKPIEELGLPAHLEKIDAAMVWGHNGKTYFYSGKQYWKFDEDEGRVELDYPRDMSMWKGVGYHIDSVFQWKDGKTYFFKGKGFWKFNDLQMRVEHEKQLPSAPFWMGCPSERGGRRAPFRSLPAPGSTLRSPSSASTINLGLTLILTSLISAFFNYLRTQH